MSVNENEGANLWPCRPNTEPGQWWCGNVGVTQICQSGKQAYFRDYTSGSILGFPPITVSPSAATQSSCEVATTTFYLPTSAATQSSCELATTTFYILASSPAKMSTTPLFSAQTQRRSTNLPTDPPARGQRQENSGSLPTAIGFGVGIPLGIAAIGFLGFLFWKAAGRQRNSKSHILSHKHALGNGDQSASAVVDRPGTGLPDAQLPIELADTSKRGLPSV